MIAAAAAATFAAVSTAVAAVAATVATIGTAISIGMTAAGLSGVFATAMTALKVLSVASSIYSLTRKPRSSAGVPSPVAFKADPNASITFVAGEAAVGGNIVFGQTHAPKNRFLTYITVLSHGGPVQSVQPFTASDEVVTFTADNGEGAGGRYKDRMWQKFALGVVGAAALAMTSTATKYTPARAGALTEWTANHKLSGMAHTMLTLWSDTERLPNGVPKPLWVVHGGPVYDPRKDSTQTGGVGPQRWNDRTTWSLVGNENPYLHAVTFLLGHYYNGVKFGGAGIHPSGIDMPAFIVGANIADANGWKISYPWTTGMRKWDVLATMLQAGGGRPIARGAKISCAVQTPRVSIGEITDNDLIADFSTTGSQTVRDRINTVIPRCRDPRLKWSVQPYGKVTAANYVAEDGEVKPREIDYESVSGKDGGRQARQLAAYDLTALREGLVATLPLSVKFRRYRAGDCLTINAPETLLNGQKVIVIKREFDPTALSVTLTVQSETDAKHAFALGQTDAPPATPELSGVDPLVLEPPAPEAWTVEPGVSPGGGGGGGAGGNGEAPVIVIRPAEPGGAGGDYTGRDDEPSAKSILIRYRRAGIDPVTGITWPWAAELEFAVSDDGYEITGLAPGVLYQLQIAYKARGVTSDWTDYGTVQTGALVSTNAEALGWRAAADILADLDAVPGIIDDAVAGLDLAVAELWAVLETPGTGLLDRATALEQTTTNLQTSKADASRVTALEASVNTPGTGLLARAGALETATANLETGKADASRVTALEARADTLDIRSRPHANLLLNPSAADGLNGWTQSGTAGWVAERNPTRGDWFRRDFPSVAGLNAALTATPFPVTVGASYVLSGNYRVTGRTAGSVYIQIDYVTAAGAIVPGGSFARAMVNGEGEITPMASVAPAGAEFGRVFLQLGGVSSDPTATFSAWRLKAEAGTVATPFSDEATLSAEAAARRLVTARVATLETATADLAAGKADASRVTSLEATVNTPATGLLARATALETATANLETGKADASRVTLLEATSTRATAITPNPYFSLTNFANGAAPPGWYGIENIALTSRVTGKVGANAWRLAAPAATAVKVGLDSPTNFAAPSGPGTYVLEVVAEKASGSWRHTIVDMQVYTAGFVTLRRQVWFGLGEGVPVGGAPVSVDGVTGRLTRWAFMFDLADGATTDRWQIQIHNGSTVYFPGPTLAGTVDFHAAFIRPATATEIETRQARGTYPSVSARIAVEELATADLYGRTQARWKVGATVPGTTAFIEAEAELTPGAAPTSSVTIGARKVALFNEVGGDWKLALEIANGNAVFTGGLTAGAYIRLGNGQGWPVALKAVDFTASDGDVVAFGTDLVSLPSLTFAMNNLAPLTTGETYNVYADALTATGFTLRAKINIPATPTQQVVTGPALAVTINTYPGYYMERGAAPDSADGSFVLSAYGVQAHRIYGNGGGQQEYDNEDYQTTTIQVFARKGGVWTFVTNIFAESMADPDFYPVGIRTVNESWSIYSTVTVGAGATAIAVVRLGASNGLAGSVQNFSKMEWQAQGAGSGTRTATPNGEKTRITVRPQ